VTVGGLQHAAPFRRHADGGELNAAAQVGEVTLVEVRLLDLEYGAGPRPQGGAPDVEQTRRRPARKALDRQRLQDRRWRIARGPAQAGLAVSDRDAQRVAGGAGALIDAPRERDLGCVEGAIERLPFADRTALRQQPPWARAAG
jgi:hypothetical protein